MSFGFSPSDFVTIAKLIRDIRSCFQLDRSASEYQELSRELESLQRVLQHVDQLTVPASQGSILHDTKLSALSCQHLLTDFRRKLHKFEATLGVKNPKRNFRDLKSSFQWKLLEKDVMQLRRCIGLHLGAINALLTSNGQSTLSLTANQAVLNQDTVMTLAKDIQTQGQLNVANQSLFTRIESGMEAVIGNLNRLTCMEERFTHLAQDVCMRFDNLQRDISLYHAPTMWHQEPVHFEDALGRVYPIASEYDYPLVVAIIEHKFSRGTRETSEWNHRFRLRNVQNSALPVTRHDFSGFLPGAYIKMVISRFVTTKTAICRLLRDHKAISRFVDNTVARLKEITNPKAMKLMQDSLCDCCKEEFFSFYFTEEAKDEKEGYWYCEYFSLEGVLISISRSTLNLLKARASGRTTPRCRSIVRSTLNLLKARASGRTTPRCRSIVRSLFILSKATAPGTTPRLISIMRSLIDSDESQSFEHAILTAMLATLGY